MTKDIVLTVYQGLAGDRNALGIAGAASLARALCRRLRIDPDIVGAPEPPLNAGWDVELAAALPGLTLLGAQCDRVLAQGNWALTALPRCAAALATVPPVARHRPDAVVLWFDAHADLNTPETTSTGYLGGLALSGPLGLWQSGLGNGLSIRNVVLAGVRDIDPPELDLIKDEAVSLVPPGPDFAARLASAIAGRPVYMHLDCDVLEPGQVPTDYHVPGGLPMSDLAAASAVVAASEVIGLEIAEYQNAWEPDGPPASPDVLLDALMPVIDRGRGA